MTLTKYSKFYVALALVCILSLSAWMRVSNLANIESWEDDYLQLDRATMPLEKMFTIQKWQGQADTQFELQPPLYFTFLHGVLNISHSIYSARMLGVMIGVMATLGIFMLAKRLYNTETGLLAALLISTSLFHVYFSRLIKSYELFFCLSVWSSYFLVKATESKRLWHWVAYALTALGMLYSGYVGLPTVFGQLLWAGVVAWSDWRQKKEGYARLLLSWGSVSVVVFLLYVPWLHGALFINAWLSIQGQGAYASMTLDKALAIVSYFLYHVLSGYEFSVPLYLALLALGVMSSIRDKQTRSLYFLLSWSIFPICSVLLAPSTMSSIVQARHLIGGAGLIVILPAFGVWSLGAPLRRRWGRHAAIVMSFLVLLPILLPSMNQFQDVDKIRYSMDRDYISWVQTTLDPQDVLQAAGWQRKSLQFALGWYLPVNTNQTGWAEKPGIVKTVFVDSELNDAPFLTPPAGIQLSKYEYGFYKRITSRIYSLSRAPLIMSTDGSGVYTYNDNFTSFKIIEDSWSRNNIVVDLYTRTAAPVKNSMPSEVVYKFITSDGNTYSNASIKIGAKLFKHKDLRKSDAKLDVFAGTSLDDLRSVYTLTQDDFDHDNGKLQLGSQFNYHEMILSTYAQAQVDVKLPALLGNELFIVVKSSPGNEHGILEMSSFTMTANVSGSSPDGQVAVRSEIQRMCDNARVTRWAPESVKADGGLFAFATTDAYTVHGGICDNKDYTLFRRYYPQLQPAYVFHSDVLGDGELLFFELPIKLTSTSPSCVVNSLNGQVQAVTLRGKADIASFRAGETALDLPVHFPDNSTTLLNFGSRGVVFWEPVYSVENESSWDFSRSENMQPIDGGKGGLGCKDDKPCFFEHSFVSGLPMTDFSIQWYPRVMDDPAQHNFVELYYKADDGEWQLLDRLQPQGSMRWTPLFSPHARQIVFPKPVNHLTLRFVLSGGGAQIWSHERVVDRLFAQVGLDARSLSPLKNLQSPAALELLQPRKNNFCIWFSPVALPLNLDLKGWQR